MIYISKQRETLLYKKTVAQVYRHLYGPITCPSPYKRLYLFLLQFKTWERRWMWWSSSYGNTYRAQRWTIHHLLILCHLYGKFTNPFILFTLFVSWGTQLNTQAEETILVVIRGNTVMGFVLHVWVVKNLESLSRPGKSWNLVVSHGKLKLCLVD